MAWFTLRRIDPATRCFTDECHFETSEVRRVLNIIDENEAKAGDWFELSADEYVRLVDEFKLDMPSEVELGELIWHHNDAFDRRPTHTGRELLLMLEGKKPFAAFVDTVPITVPDVIPEALFEPYVAAGRFIKREAIEDSIAPDGKPIQLRRVMYAMPGQEWRFDAFLKLWALAGKHGWSDGFEKMEGFLYGYEAEIDPYFEK